MTRHEPLSADTGADALPAQASGGDVSPASAPANAPAGDAADEVLLAHPEGLEPVSSTPARVTSARRGGGDGTVERPTAIERSTATPVQTLGALTRQAGRGYTVVRNVFVQVKVGRQWQGSSLGRLVSGRQPRALLAYLLLLMVSNALGRRPQPLEAAVWARALSKEAPHPAMPEKAMTPVWAVLAKEPHTLITKGRQGRLVKPSPRREDGRAEWTRPRPDEFANGDGELFFVLPDAFWLQGWHHRLHLPGIAVLLILLHGTQGRDEARLTPERAQDWYGISTKTMENGLEELRRLDLVTWREEWVPAPLSKIGRTKHVYFQLTGPFSRQERQRIQREAVTATQQRALRISRGSSAAVTASAAEAGGEAGEEASVADLPAAPADGSPAAMTGGVS